MLKFSYNKLVRDKIVDRQIASGSHPSFRELNNAEHKEQLVAKIIEEAKELVAASPDDLASEIADVQQAIDDLRELASVSTEAVAKAQHAKNEKNGPFKKGLYIEYVEVDENDEWVKYYRDNSDRYPEIR